MRSFLAAGALAASLAGAFDCSTSTAQQPPPSAPVVNTSTNLDLAFETSDFMRRAAYHDVSKLNEDSSPAGAYGPVNRAWEQNHEAPWYIEEQRVGGDVVVAGIVTNDASTIDRGLRMLEWGAQQQQPDGSFDCGDAFHSTSFFIEAAAHALLVMHLSGFDKQFASRVDYLTPRIHNAALWMVRPEVLAAGKRHNAPFTHRRYAVAAALGETGVLTHDDALVKTSREFVYDGLSLQDPSGYNPEKGGFDSSYHAVGVYYAERYYAWAASDDLKRPLFDMLSRAMAWEASRIAPDGTVMAEGNSRVGDNPEHDRANRTKKLAVGQVFRAFAFWSMISNTPTYLELAVRVATAAHRFSG
jgi:hypothetical protein